MKRRKREVRRGATVTLAGVSVILAAGAQAGCSGTQAAPSDASAAGGDVALDSGIDATRGASVNDGSVDSPFETADGDGGSAPSDAPAGRDSDGEDSGTIVDSGAVDAASVPAIACSPDAGGAVGASGAPLLLGCTGLYSDWSSQTIATSAVAYDPGLHLWSDGAVKTRYVALPPGTQIDTSDMDEWTFPIGTKIWKQFVVAGLKVETRYLYKNSAYVWVYTTYQWSPDQTRAVELTTGALDVNGTGYEIPYLDECRTCHMGRLDFVLGFEAIALSTPMATGLNMSALVAGGWLTQPPAAPLAIPGDATASAALGWLHANCGTACHNPSPYSLAGSTGFFMRLESSELGSVEATGTYTTGVNVTATFKEPDGGSLLRIAPGNPAGSCVVFRDGYRDTDGQGIQMPPQDTHVVDTADLSVVEGWITSL
jgi:hypothetical protein